MTPEQEQATIRHCTEVLEKQTGQRPQGWLSPILAWTAHTDDFLVQDIFDYLYAGEPLSLLVMTLHCHFGGRPLMSAQMHKLLRYFSGHPGVWFPSP